MSEQPFEVSRGRHFMSSVVHCARPFWRGLGHLESLVVRNKIEQTPIIKPLYVAGLARSGTSILIEILASHPDVATHQYRDFPFLFIPYWWRQTLERSAPPLGAAQERAHGDRLMVTPGSPEAMEEVLWMAYFNRLHNPHASNVLGPAESNPAFERFYRDHIRKLLLISGRKRYATKGNYNLTRLEYLLRLFPNARFVLAVRRPREHIASLMKQHKLFRTAADGHPRSVAHLDRVGHFEFGLHRRCINTDGRTEVIESIEQLWRGGQEVRGWARYWATLYHWLDQRLQSNHTLRQATCIIRYEDLCDDAPSSIAKLLAHCALDDRSGEIIREWAGSISKPRYYQPDFSPEEELAIVEETAAVAAGFGYAKSFD